MYLLIIRKFIPREKYGKGGGEHSYSGGLYGVLPPRKLQKVSLSQDHPTGDKKKDLSNEMGSFLITSVIGSPHS